MKRVWKWVTAVWNWLTSFENPRDRKIGEKPKGKVGKRPKKSGRK